jgi:hypothetical protein
VRPTVLLALVLAVEEIAIISAPLVASPLRGVLGVTGLGMLLATTFFAFGFSFRRSRLVSVAIAAAIVATWTAFRAVVMHDPDVIRIALAIQGVVLAMIALVALMTWVHRRGWIVDSPLRRRLAFAGVLVGGLLFFLGTPAEPLNGRLRLAAMGLGLAAMFWPARTNRPAPSGR